MIRTLLVEDNDGFRRALRGLLESVFPRMEIGEARNEEEVVGKLERLRPDLVFMDIKLPGASGLELTRRIKQCDRDIVVVILTTYDLPEYREAATRTGANYFLSKGSVSMEEIVRLVRAVAARIDGGPPGTNGADSPH